MPKLDLWSKLKKFLAYGKATSPVYAQYQPLNNVDPNVFMEMTGPKFTKLRKVTEEEAKPVAAEYHRLARAVFSAKERGAISDFTYSRNGRNFSIHVPRPELDEAGRWAPTSIIGKLQPDIDNIALHSDALKLDQKGRTKLQAALSLLKQEREAEVGKRVLLGTLGLGGLGATAAVATALRRNKDNG